MGGLRTLPPFRYPALSSTTHVFWLLCVGLVREVLLEKLGRALTSG